MKMTDARRMAIDGIGPITMTFNLLQGDYQSCKYGWSQGQALCAEELDLFFNVTKAKVIEVIPKRRPGKNRVKIERTNQAGYLRIDGERWNLYMRTVRTANHWIDKGYKYVQIEIIR